jgi:hypothetical protein
MLMDWAAERRDSGWVEAGVGDEEEEGGRVCGQRRACM